MVPETGPCWSRSADCTHRSPMGGRMTLLEASVLGVVQGVTEFLPISSIAHLRVVPALLGWEDPGAAFSAVIQLGTLVAVLVYFAGDLRTITQAAVKGVFGGAPWASQEARLAWFIVIGTFPIGICGLAFKKSHRRRVALAVRHLREPDPPRDSAVVGRTAGRLSAGHQRHWLAGQPAHRAGAGGGADPGAPAFGHDHDGRDVSRPHARGGGAFLLPPRDSGHRRGRGSSSCGIC